MPKISEVMKKSTQEINNRNDTIEQLISHGGYGIIGADRDMGKTNEALHLVCMFANKGQAYYHGLKVQHCKVLYVNFEDNPIKIGQRLKKITSQYDLDYDPEMLFTDDLKENLNLDTESGSKYCLNLINRYRKDGYNIEVVIMDSMKFTCSGDYSKPQVALTWAKSVKKLASELNISFIFLHHTRKLVYYQGHYEDLYSGDRIKGAGDLIDHSDATLLFARESKVVRDSATGRLTKTHLDALVPIRHRNALVDLVGNPLYVSLDRNTLKWMGEYWCIENGMVEVKNEKLL